MNDPIPCKACTREAELVRCLLDGSLLYHGTMGPERDLLDEFT